MFTLVATRQFERRVAKFREVHPEVRKQLARVLRDLESDPFLPRLRLHPLGGPLKGLHAVRITRAYRITLTLKVTEHEVVLLDIGTHDEVYR